MITHGSIVPLIGGETIGQAMAFRSKPTVLYSFDAFKTNETHLQNYYKDVPFHYLDNVSDMSSYQKVDVLNATCPCSGLSSLSVSASANNKTNDWMIKTATLVLEQLQPTVFWGENAPRLFSKMGRPVVDKLFGIAQKNGYSLTLYKTRSRNHGLPQTRERTFYVFWKDKGGVMLPTLERPMMKLKEFMKPKIDGDPMDVPVRKDKPSDSLWYQYIKETYCPSAKTHEEFVQQIVPEKFGDCMYILEQKGGDYNTVADWMLKRGQERIAARCKAVAEKIASGKNVMRNTVILSRDYVGAFVGCVPTILAHPTEDRYFTYRECLDMMCMPRDFELLNPKKNLNHICQNVPVTTACDIASMIKDGLEGKLQFSSDNLLFISNV
jgi:site-specific DNA-cytosine methylase